jgi:hypothetical protein
MRRILLIVVILTLLAGLIPLVGCSTKTKIGDIMASPTQYEGKEVHIQGTVGETLWFAAINKGAYQIGDGSGTIWVVAIQPPPQKGTNASAKGTVSTAIKIGDRSLGTVITESQRK